MKSRLLFLNHVSVETGVPQIYFFSNLNCRNDAQHIEEEKMTDEHETAEETGHAHTSLCMLFLS